MTKIDGDSMSARSRSSAVPPDVATTEMDIGDLYSAVARRWRLLAPALAVTMSLAGIYIAVTPARYAASMSFLVDTRERPPIGVDAQPIAQNPDTGLIESQMRLLTSNEVLRRTVNDQQLRFDPEFAPAGSLGIVAKIKTFLGMAPPKADNTIDNIVETLGRAITTKRSEKSYVIDVEVKASSPEKAERLARALANAYYETQSKMGDDIADKESEWLDKKILDFRTRLEQAEQRVEEYRKSQSILITDGHTSLEQQLKDANSALVEARGKRAEMQAKFAQLQAAIHNDGSIGGLSEAIHSPMIEKLRGDYAALSRDAAYAESTLGPRHPSYVIIKAQMASLRTQITAEMRRISIAQDHDLKAARSTESAAEQFVADLQKSINDNGGRRLELNELERQAAAVRDRYEKALAARENVHREVVSSPNGVMIDQPIAQKTKVSPRTLPALIIAFAAGLNLWIATALVLEFLERKRIGSAGPSAQPGVAAAPEQVNAFADERAEATLAQQPAENRWRAEEEVTPIVVPLPAFDARHVTVGRIHSGDTGLILRARKIMESPGAAPYRRAITDLYDSLWTVPILRTAPVVAIAANVKSVGVSTTALSLALLACSQGDRVLLMDCNPQHPTFATLLPKLAPVKKRFGFDRPLFLYRREHAGTGEILLSQLDAAKQDWPSEQYFKSKFDLIILDCGVLTEAGQGLPPAEEIDAVIMIERDERGERNACLLFGSEAGEKQNLTAASLAEPPARMRA